MTGWLGCCGRVLAQYVKGCGFEFQLGHNLSCIFVINNCVLSIAFYVMYMCSPSIYSTVTIPLLNVKVSAVIFENIIISEC